MRWEPKKREKTIPKYRIIGSDKPDIMKYVSKSPIWLYCTNTDFTNGYWASKNTTDSGIKRLLESYFLDVRILTEYTCMIQVELSNKKDAETFYNRALELGIRIKGISVDNAPDNDYPWEVDN